MIILTPPTIVNVIEDVILNVTQLANILTFSGWQGWANDDGVVMLTNDGSI